MCGVTTRLSTTRITKRAPGGPTRRWRCSRETGDAGGGREGSSRVRHRGRCRGRGGLSLREPRGEGGGGQGILLRLPRVGDDPARVLSAPGGTADRFEDELGEGSRLLGRRAVRSRGRQGPQRRGRQRRAPPESGHPVEEHSPRRGDRTGRGGTL